MIQLVILSGLVAAASCMVLHEAPIPLYYHVQHQVPAPSYNVAYEVNDARTGDFKKLQESRTGGVVVGQYSLLQPDGVTRTVDYRADDLNGFNAVVNNEGRPYSAPPERQEETADGSARQDSGRYQEDQFQQSNEQEATPRPLTLERTALIHHVLRQYRHDHST